VTLEKIAEEMGMQPAAVRMQISRARKALREKFRKEYENV
jgi:DNA-directed RNA polymerase specialized sigma24 family protein